VAPFKKYIFRQGLIITENGEQFFVDQGVYSCIRNSIHEVHYVTK
jgi:hypothetical protein